MKLKIDRIDHVLMTVADINSTIHFYERTLGMKSDSFGDGRQALAFGRSKFTFTKKEKSSSRKQRALLQDH
jgi:catechol 2,3-dioxygenase-like lactoylglutathione lyase family enzyme